MSGMVVVDTSIALKWVLVESDTPLAEALLNEWVSQGVRLVAPVLLLYEVANIPRQQVRKSILTQNEALDALRRVLAQGIAIVPLDQSGLEMLSTHALELASQHGLPATYDAHYLALAEREGCEYWTADERLRHAVKARLPWVRWLGERASTAGAP